MKNIYYYYRLYPERGILKLKIIDELFLRGKKINSIQYLVTNYDVERYEKRKNIWMSVTQYEDADVYSHDFSISRYGGDLILSYNLNKLNDWWLRDFKRKKKELEDRLKEFNKDGDIK